VKKVEFSWSEEEVRFRQSVRDFIRDNLPAEWWSRVPGEEPYSAVTLNFCRKLGAQGLLMPHWPKEYGGGGDNSPWRSAILAEELWSNGEPRGSQYMNSNWIGPAIISAGNEEQRKRFLPPMAAGEALWCQGFSEVDAGSDLASMQTLAVRDGDDYVINGEKVWTSYAKGAHHCFLLARTDPKAAGGEGISIFLVPMTAPGLKVEVIDSVLDIHVIHRLTFKNVRIPIINRLGAENAGWAIIRAALSDERVGTPRHIRASIILENVVQEASRNGRLDAVALRQAAHARAACQAARIFVYKIRQARSVGDAGAEAYLARAAIVNAERAVADVAANLAGPEGLISGSLSDGEFRTTLIAGLGGGSYEMQLNLIARLWLKLPKAV
jgi:alkylation response protein AidB-like acyl-CoA dehydrogenase